MQQEKSRAPLSNVWLRRHSRSGRWWVGGGMWFKKMISIRPPGHPKRWLSLACLDVTLARRLSQSSEGGSAGFVFQKESPKRGCQAVGQTAVALLVGWSHEAVCGLASLSALRSAEIFLLRGSPAENRRIC